MKKKELKQTPGSDAAHEVNVGGSTPTSIKQHDWYLDTNGNAVHGYVKGQTVIPDDILSKIPESFRQWFYFDEGLTENQARISSGYLAHYTDWDRPIYSDESWDRLCDAIAALAWDTDIFSNYNSIDDIAGTYVGYLSELPETILEKKLDNLPPFFGSFYDVGEFSNWIEEKFIIACVNNYFSEGCYLFTRDANCSDELKEELVDVVNDLESL